MQTTMFWNEPQSTTRATLTGPFLSLLMSLGALLFSVGAMAQEAPLVQPGTTVKISDHVHIIPDNSRPTVPNVGFVVGEKAVLVVDTGMGRRNGETVVNEAQKLAGNKPLYLVTTHVHPEHDLGAEAFPATTKMIRARTQVNEITEFGMQMADVFRKRSDAMRELLEGAQFRKADIVFDEEYSLDLGGVRARIFAMGSNHTPGDTVTLVEQDGVMFSGDVAMKNQPAFASPKSSLMQWLTSLDRLEAMKPRLLVPSHGPTGDASFISNYRAYLTRIRDQASAAKRDGKSLEETTKTIVEELKTQYPDAGRLSGAVRVAYNEAK